MENLLKHKLEKMLIFDRKILEVAISTGVESQGFVLEFSLIQIKFLIDGMK